MLKRISLWLALGNAGGLAAVASRFEESLHDRIAYVLFPSLWAFAIGLVCAAVFSLVFGMWHAEDESEPSGVGWTVAITTATFLVGSIAFIFGLLYPLTVLSLRYISTGAFTG